MSDVSLHPTAHTRNVAFEQMRAVGLLTRSGATILSVSLGLVGLLMAYLSIARRNNAALRHVPTPLVSFDFAPQMAILFAGVAFIYPFFVWLNEDPTQRAYHWMMPVDRAAHALWKVLGGWTWTMIATAFTLLAIVAIREIITSITGRPQSPQNFAWWAWLIPFTSGTLAYLLASAAVVGARRPIVKVATVAGAYVATIGVLILLDFPNAARTVVKLFFGQYGFEAAFLGQFRTDDAPSLERWLVSTVIWGAGVAVLLLWSANRKPSRS